jgi:hypothetical protein
MDKMQQLEERIQYLETIISDFVYSDRYISQKHMQFLDGKNIQLARGTGTQIGTDTDQKLAFFGGTPVVRQATISDPGGGANIDTEARTAINTIIDRLQAYNLIA